MVVVTDKRIVRRTSRTGEGTSMTVVKTGRKITMKHS